MPKTKDRSHLEHVKAVLVIAKAALTGFGMPGVEAIPGVPLEIITIYETMKANKEDLTDLLGHIEVLNKAILNPMQEARPRYGFSVPDDIRVRLEKLIAVFKEAKQKVARYEDVSFGERLFKRSQITKALKDASEIIGQAIEAFQLESQVTAELFIRDINHGVQKVGVEVQKIDNHVQDHGDRTVLSELRPAFGGLNVSDKSACLTGTREKLLGDIQSDLSRPELALVCLYGSPGTGKSAVAKSIAMTLRGEGILAASYFFDKRGGRTAGNISIPTLISTLAHEFALVNPHFRSEIIAQLRRDSSLSSSNKDTRFEQLFLVPLRSVPIPPRPFVIVLDALDEYGAYDAQRALAELLRRCAVSPEFRSRIIFLLTSRPEFAIANPLERNVPALSSAFHRMNELDEAQTQADIELFVRDHLQTLQQEIARSSPTLQEHEVTQFAELSSGLFEIAALLLRQLDKRCRLLRLSLADGISRIKSDMGLSSMSEQLTLSSVYAAILETAYDDLKGLYAHVADLHAGYQRVVGALACLREPLTLTALCALVDVDKSTAEAFLLPLASLVNVPNNGPIQFYHASFLDFLISKPAVDPVHAIAVFAYFVSPVQSNTALAQQSLSVMNNLLHRNMLGLPEPTIMNNDIPDLPLQCSHFTPEHLRYASLYWAEHLRVEDIPQHNHPLVHWCNAKIIYYLEVLSLLGEIERAVPLLGIAENWARNNAALAPVVPLLNDCQRLVQMFYPAITESAGAVYSSAIALMPSCHFLEQYSPLTNGGPILLRGRLPTWPVQIWVADQPNDVWSVVFSPDGRYIVSASEDNVIRLLSARTGRTEQLLKGHTSIVLSVAFSPDGARIVSGSSDGTVRIWSAASGEQEQVLEGPPNDVQSVSFSPDGSCVASGSTDGTVRIWSLDSGERERVLEGHTDHVNSVAFSPDGAHIVSGSDDYTLRVWSAASGKEERVLKGHTKGVNSIAFSPDRARIISGSDDRTVRIWSAASGEQEQVLKGHTSWVRSVAFSPDSARVVSGSDDGTVRIWSAASGEQQRLLKGHTNSVNSIAFSPDGSRIVSGSADDTVRIWSLDLREQERVLEGGIGRVDSVAFSPDGARIVSGSDDGTICIWSAASGEQEQVLKGRTSWVRSVAFSPDSARVVSGSNDGTVRIWSAASGEQLRLLKGHTSSVNSVAFSPDGQAIKSDSYRKTLFWDVKTGRELDQDHPLAQSSFHKEAETMSQGRAPEEGWLSINGLSIWLPRYILGRWWSAHGIVVMSSRDTPRMLALIRLPSYAGFDRM